MYNLWCSENRVDKLDKAEWLKLQNLHKCLADLLSSFLQGENYSTIWMMLANTINFLILWMIWSLFIPIIPSPVFHKVEKILWTYKQLPTNFILCTKYKLSYFVDNESRVRGNQEVVTLYLLCIFSYIFHLFFSKDLTMNIVCG